ncbi:hypothetical protein LJR230_003629 [Trinickia sp. LjRoot230]|uniref:hypothetical protein n=1 Tax=Trinickia sp. LjRoot230 TaxID=3342288 RepID=UPI003ECD3D8C
MSPQAYQVFSAPQIADQVRQLPPGGPNSGMHLFAIRHAPGTSEEQQQRAEMYRVRFERFDAPFFRKENRNELHALASAIRDDALADCAAGRISSDAHTRIINMLAIVSLRLHD